MDSNEAGWTLFAYTVTLLVCLLFAKCVLITPIERSIDKLTIAVEKISVKTSVTNQ